jgi:hypothetical protein
MLIRKELFTLMRIRNRIPIPLLIKVMGICGHWSIDPTGPFKISVHGPIRLSLSLKSFYGYGSNFSL